MRQGYPFRLYTLPKTKVFYSKLKDYIALPKSNGYQSIHITIMYEGVSVEIQIRSEEMHYLAEYGTAAHVKYKKGDVIQ